MSRYIQRFDMRCKKCIAALSWHDRVRCERAPASLEVYGATKSGDGIKFAVEFADISVRYSKAAYDAHRYWQDSNNENEQCA